MRRHIAGGTGNQLNIECERERRAEQRARLRRRVADRGASPAKHLLAMRWREVLSVRFAVAEVKPK